MSIGQVYTSIPPSWKRPNPEDYVGEDGLLYCGKCHTPKQCWAPAIMHIPARVVNCACDCRREQVEREEKQRKVQIEIERLSREGLTDKAYSKNTFENDDGQRPKLLAACKRYCDAFVKDLEPEGTGILFYGPTGTGKTYLACCIVNELIANGISAMVTSLPTMINIIQNDKGGESEKLYDRIRNVRLLVIDDLGVESKTPYRMEVAYQIIDTRYRSGKPLIVTTNLTKEQLMNPATIEDQRIYERILERCKPIAVLGESRRKQKYMKSMANSFGNTSEIG